MPFLHVVKISQGLKPAFLLADGGTPKAVP
jgi:hypothetical protein